MEITERSVEIPWLLDNVGTAKRVLDIGSYGAGYALALAGMVGELCSIDLRKPAIANGRFYHMSVTDMPESWSGAYDLVTCISTLDHVGLSAYGHKPIERGVETAVSEMYRVLRLHGRLLLTVPIGKPQIVIHERYHGEQRVFSVDEIADLFPEHRWLCDSSNYWLLRRGRYMRCGVDDVANAGYDGYRAGAAAAYAFIKITEDFT